MHTVSVKVYGSLMGGGARGTDGCMGGQKVRREGMVSSKEEVWTCRGHWLIRSNFDLFWCLVKIVDKRK